MEPPTWTFRFPNIMFRLWGPVPSSNTEILKGLFIAIHCNYIVCANVHLVPCEIHTVSEIRHDCHCNLNPTGLLVPDLPMEETAIIRAAAGAAGLQLTMLCTPTTPEPRMNAIAGLSEGFVYLVSVAGACGNVPLRL